MGVASTDRTITGPVRFENGSQPGVFGVTSRDTGAVLTVAWGGQSGSDIAELVHTGDSVNINLHDIDWVEITASRYPARALILNTNTGSAVLTGAPFASAGSAGGVLFHADLISAGTLYTAPAGSRLVIFSASVSAESGEVVQIVDSDGAYLVHTVGPGAVARYFGDPDGYQCPVYNDGSCFLDLAGTGTFWGSVHGMVVPI